MSQILIQRASEASDIPEDALLERWCLAAMAEDKRGAEVLIRVCDKAEIQELNRDFRHKDYPTNVLSFPSTVPEFCEIDALGDMIICAAIVSEEARAQNKALHAHWAHMVVHGCLHLQGYDHIEDAEAEAMESLETQIITALGFPPPYGDSGSIAELD